MTHQDRARIARRAWWRWLGVTLAAACDDAIADPEYDRLKGYVAELHGLVTRLEAARA